MRFLVVISHFWGVISRFLVCFCATRPLFRAQRDFFLAFFPPRGREQNVKFPLCQVAFFLKGPLISEMASKIGHQILVFRGVPWMNEISRKPAHTVAELTSARQHQENWPTIMERAVEGAISWRALAIELSSARFTNSHIRAPIHVHLRSPGSRPTLWRGLDEDSYLKEVRNKRVTGPGRSKKKKNIYIYIQCKFSSSLVRTACFMRGCAHLALYHESRGDCSTWALPRPPWSMGRH